MKTFFGALVISIVLAAPVLFTSQYFWGSGIDLPISHQPLREAGYQALRNGEWPLWNPSMVTGLPFQTGLRNFAYPLHALGLFLSAGLQIKVSIVAHTMLAIGFMAGALQWLGMSRPSSLLGGVVYGSSGFAYSHLFAGHLDSFEPVAYVPAILWTSLIAFRRRGIGWTVLAGLTIGWMGLAGHYQPIYIGLFGVFGYLTLLCLTGSRHGCLPLSVKVPWMNGAHDREAKEDPWSLSCVVVPRGERLRDVWNWGQRAAAMGLVAVGVALFRLLPSAQSILASNRVETDPSIQMLPCPWQTLYTYIVPHLFENPSDNLGWSFWPMWETQGYIGVVALCLIAVSLLGDPRNWALPVGMMTFSLLISLGSNTPLYDLWRRVDPLLQNFRSPGRFTLLVALFGAWLAALGLELLIKGRVRKARASAASAAITVLAAGFTIWLWGQGQAMQGWAGFVHALTSQENWDMLSDGANRDNLAGLLHSNQKAALLALGLAILTNLSIAYFRSFTAHALLALAVLDAVIFVNPYLRTAPPSDFDLPPEIVEVIKTRDPSARVLWSPDLNWYSHFAPYGLCEASGYDYFFFPEYIQSLNLQDGLPISQPRLLVSTDQIGPFWNLHGVRFIVRTTPVEASSPLILVRQVGDLLVYENPAALPRAFVVHKVEQKPKPEILEKAARASEAFRDTAFFAAEEPLPNLTPSTMPAEPIDSLVLKQNSASVEVDLESAGILVLTNAPWPGWTVTVDGENATLLKVNGSLHQGVEVAAGAHTIVFSYWPATLGWGLLGSLLTWLAALFLSRPWQLLRRQESLEP